MRQWSRVNVSVSNHYRKPSHASEITTQGLLGELIEILETHASFTRIRQEDGYESWISTDQICSEGIEDGSTIMVRSHFMRIYKKPSTLANGIRDAVIGCRLMVVDEEGDWYKVSSSRWRYWLGREAAFWRVAWFYYGKYR